MKEKKPKKAPPATTRARSAVRRAWMRSVERGACLKRDGYTCRVCGVKQSIAKGRVVKVVVHHIDGVRWTGTFREMAEDMYCGIDRLLTLCKKCHADIHKEDGE